MPRWWVGNSPYRLFRTVVSERKQREFDPTIQDFLTTIANHRFAREDACAQQNVKESFALMEILSMWVDEILRLESVTLAKVIKLVAKVISLVRSKSFMTFDLSKNSEKQTP